MKEGAAGTAPFLWRKPLAWRKSLTANIRYTFRHDVPRQTPDVTNDRSRTRPADLGDSRLCLLHIHRLLGGQMIEQRRPAAF